jgi:hypothetical protein
MNELEARVMKQTSPPKLGGVPASLSEQAGWFQRRMFQEFGRGTTPALRAAPPNLGGELPRLKTL